LVLKVTKLEAFPHHQQQLKQALSSVSGILIDRYMDRQELDGLFETCDAYVSLHRSEGFGVTMAEAMRLAKPTIATGYSGNVDFMNVGNSYLVDYRLIELDRDFGPYPQGSVWADPELDHAAAQMRQVFENREEAIQKGTRAAAELQDHYGGEATAKRVIERLAQIQQNQGRALMARARRQEIQTSLVSDPTLQQLRERAMVNPHLPIAWPYWPKGFWPKTAALFQKVTRRLLRWYIDPIVEQQNRFNASTIEALDTLLQELAQLQAQIPEQTDDRGPE
jgi:hypothetical protein